jgi:Golgi SNAP receptor complex protein 1
MTDYESLRRECRTLESLLDVKLTSYSRLAANIGRGTSDAGSSTSGERWQDLEGEIDGLLEKVRLESE